MLVKKTNKSTMLEYRKTKVCHPAYDGDDFGPGEEWFIPYTMKVPVTCGRFELLHHDVLAGGVGNDGTVVINTDGWKSPSLKDAINRHLLPHGWSITDEWFIVTPIDKYPVVDYMRLNSSGRLLKPDQETVDLWAKKLRVMPSRIKWYTQHVMDTLKRNKMAKCPDIPVTATEIEEMINSATISRYLPGEVSEKMKVSVGSTREFKEALEGYLLVSLGLPFNV